MTLENVIGFVFVACIAVCVIYDFLQRRFFPTRPPLREAAKTDLILLILGAYVLTVTLRLDQIDRNLQDALPSPSNQYDQSLTTSHFFEKVARIDTSPSVTTMNPCPHY